MKRVKQYLFNQLFVLFTLLLIASSLTNAQWGNALSFSGTFGENCHLGFSPDINDNFTIEALVKSSNPVSNQIIFYCGKSDENGFGLVIDGVESELNILFGGQAWIPTGVTMDTEVKHLALTRNSGSWTIYVNGVSVLSEVTTVPIAPTTDLNVGGDRFNGGFIGVIDEFRLSSTVRYTSNFTPLSTPFSTDGNTLGLYHFDEGSGLTVSDASVNGWHMSLQGGTKPSWVVSTLPVELTSFSASSSINSVILHWATATEVNNYGFEIERGLPPSPLPKEGGVTPLPLGKGQGDGLWELVGFVEGNGNSNSPKEYSFVDENPLSGNLQYRLKQIDTDGRYEYYSTLAEVNFSITDVKKEQLTEEYALEQNYPNPFNPATTINYALPAAGMVTIEIYNSLGEKIAAPVNEMKNAGRYEVVWNADGVSSGIYFYTIMVKVEGGSKEFRMIRKMMMLK